MGSPKRVLLAAGGFVLGLLVIGCQKSGDSGASQNSATAHPFSPGSELFIEPHVSRHNDGRIVISGSTNLPDGLKMWVAVEEGKLPKGAPKEIAADNDVVVQDGKFSTKPLWKSVPNTRFTKSGWPSKMNVDERQVLFPAKSFKVHFLSVFNGAWQTKNVIETIGGEGGKHLKGKILTVDDSDVIDSRKTVDYRVELAFPSFSSEAKAISLVREAILTLPDKGRSTGDVQAVIDLFMVDSEIKPAKGWDAKQEGPSTFTVSFDFIDGAQGEQQALWQADINSGKVKYINENGKLFSWAPAY